MNSDLFAGFACARREAARTNCPTQLANLTYSIHKQSFPPRSSQRRKCSPGQESVERVVSNEDAIQELRDAPEHEEDEECVDGLEARGGGVLVRLP